MHVALERRLGVYIAVVCALLGVNNTLPYFGLRDDSCQTMFSGLDWDEDWNNHLFMPQRPLGDRWRYVHDVEAEVDPAPANERTAHLASWLVRPERRVNVDALRAVVWQLCDEGHRVRLEYRDGRRLERHTNACAHATLATPMWWMPVRLYDTDLPSEER